MPDAIAAAAAMSEIQTEFFIFRGPSGVSFDFEISVDKADAAAILTVTVFGSLNVNLSEATTSNVSVPEKSASAV